MFKRILIFAVFLLLSAAAWNHGTRLALMGHIFFPLLFLFLLYFYEEEALGRVFFYVTAAILFTVWLSNTGAHLNLLTQSAILGAGHAIFFLLFIQYRDQWQRQLLAESSESLLIQKDLDGLKQKHHSRLESLHHLEKQVAGLLDLFEIARDFNDCLSLDSVTQIMHKKVLPELPFEKMYLAVMEKGPDANAPPLFSISQAEGVKSYEEISVPGLPELLERASHEKHMVKEDTRWSFPMIIDGRMASCLIVEKAQPDDLAKFEVLTAYLTLQVKKIRLYETVRELAIRDGLTGCFVRRHFMDRLEEELKRCTKYGLPLSVLMLDIDQFKRYNDDHGHLAGDATLKQVAQLLRESLRKMDIVGRYGGEEFVMVLPETRRDGAHEVAERIRSSIARHPFKVYSEETRVTVSIGVAVFHESASGSAAGGNIRETGFELIKRADQYLYRAKQEGRNRVVVENT